MRTPLVVILSPLFDSVLRSRQLMLDHETPAHCPERSLPAGLSPLPPDPAPGVLPTRQRKCLTALIQRVWRIQTETRTIIRNRQVSGSSSLVGSRFWVLLSLPGLGTKVQILAPAMFRSGCNPNAHFAFTARDLAAKLHDVPGSPAN
jgi:hypothetical protein